MIPERRRECDVLEFANWPGSTSECARRKLRERGQKRGRKEREVESEKKMKRKGVMEKRGETMEHKGKKNEPRVTQIFIQ